jgi:ISXO2-like transposase domain
MSKRERRFIPMNCSPIVPDAHYAHQVIDHATAYVDGKIHTNGLENFWSLLKRGISGTYVSVEPFHLFRYLDEQSFRYNNCATEQVPMNDFDRFKLALSHITDKRLTYEHLIGRDREGDTTVN